MILQVEISSFDLRFEGYRLRNKAAERILLASILENGIRGPLQGVDMEQARILLNGFKRYRCARRLGMGVRLTLRTILLDSWANGKSYFAIL